MPGLREVSKDEWCKLPMWVGVSKEGVGKQFAGNYRGRTYVVTVHAYADTGEPYSVSEEVNVT